MKKKTKVNKKKLDSLLLVLLLTAVLMVMSTYAWFTANRTVSIEGFNVNVSTTSGLQISADGEDWKTVLTLEDLQKASRTHGETGKIINQLPISMEPISSALKVNSETGRMKMFYGKTIQEETAGEHEGDFYLNAIESPEISYHNTDAENPAGYYLAFDIFLKSGSPEKNLYMSGSVTELKGGSSVDTGTERGITNAARVALVVGGNIDSEDGETIRDLKTNGEVLLWEPNSDFHTEKGVKNAEDLGWVTTGALTARATDQAAVACDGVMAPIAESEKIYLQDAKASRYNTKFETINPRWKTGKNETAPNNEMPKYSYGGTTDPENALLRGVTKYRVYMWIEGQDVDCENYASGSDMQFDLGFNLGSGSGSGSSSGTETTTE